MKKNYPLVIITFLFGIFLFLFFNSCTQNQRAKNFGGKAEINLPENQKLINATWKDDNLWYLTRPMRADETPETYTFSEESSWGVWEGAYIIHERK